MRGVMLAAGEGTRLLPVTETMAKPLVPVANQPVLFYGLRDIVAAGIGEVAIIVSPKNRDEITAAVLKAEIEGLDPTFIEQPSPDGLAAALGLALPWVDGEDCLMFLGDNILEDGVAEMIRQFQEARPNCQVMLHEVADPRQFGVADLDSDGSVVQLVEKPQHPQSNLALVGAYIFDDSIGEAIGAIAPSARGELEITDAIQKLVTDGNNVRATIATGWWKDTGSKEDVLEANEYLLGKITGYQHGELAHSTVEGVFGLGEGSRLVDSRVRGPVIVGGDSQIDDSRLGPHTAIGDRCEASDAVVTRSIVMEGAVISGWRLHDSLIGPGVRLIGKPPQESVSVMLRATD